MHSSTAPAASSKCNAKKKKNGCLHSMFLMWKLLRSNFVCSQWQSLDACATESHVMPHWIRNENDFFSHSNWTAARVFAPFIHSHERNYIYWCKLHSTVFRSRLFRCCHYRYYYFLPLFRVDRISTYSFVCEQCAMCIQNNDAEQWTAFDYMFWYV